MALAESSSVTAAADAPPPPPAALPATETKAEECVQLPKSKQKPIVRLGALLVAHSVLVSVLCYTAGLVALLLLPALAKTTYISENALMPGSANPMLAHLDVSNADKFVRNLLGKVGSEKGARREIQNLIGQHMADVGAEVYYHNFYPFRNQFHPFRFFSSSSIKRKVHNNSNCAPSGNNIVGILRAPRGDGKEAIVLVSPYNSENFQLNDALTLGIGFSVISLLSRVSWLVKDIIWLAADSSYGEFAPVSAWLEDYHNPISFGSFGEHAASTCAEGSRFGDTGMYNGRKFNVFRRAGTMSAALVFKFAGKDEKDVKDSVTIYAEASNGQMPNLDLINVVHYLALHRHDLQVKVGKIDSLRHSKFLKFFGDTLQTITKFVKILIPNWNFDISAADYVEGSATIASSMYCQALGVATGSHGVFRDYQVDAVTMVLSSNIHLNNENLRSAFILRGGRLIEGIVRSVNNLLEKFHQSFFLYFLTAPNKFVSVGVYMIGFGLLLAPLPIVAAALLSFKDSLVNQKTSAEQISNSSSEDVGIATGFWKWLPSAKVVFLINLWAMMVSLIPFLLSHCSHITPRTSFISWAGLSASVLLVLYLTFGSPFSYSSRGEWRVLKATMIAAAFIGLGLMSIINFATAQIGALFLVPLCLVVQPLRRQVMGSMISTSGNFLCNLALVIIGFPLAPYFIMTGFTEVGSDTIDMGRLWDGIQFLWEWSSATYLYIVLVHLPCWVLCLHVLLQTSL